jgi:predicted Kef-type K+ transport protein
MPHHTPLISTIGGLVFGLSLSVASTVVLLCDAGTA